MKQVITALQKSVDYFSQEIAHNENKIEAAKRDIEKTSKNILHLGKQLEEYKTAISVLEDLNKAKNP